MSDSDFGMGYALGSDSGGNSNGGGMFGDSGLWAVIILAMIFGWGGNGMGFGGGYGGQALTRAELYDGFAIQNIDGAVRGVQQGICDSTYALNNAITGGFNGVQSSICGLSREISDCCCTTQRSIDAVRYDMASQACDTRNLIQNVTRDLIDNQNANTRSIMDFMVNSKIESLQAENQNLKLAASQAAQNNYLAALSDAQTAELIRRIAPQPVPSFAVPAPYPYCGAGSSGCGCGC